MHMSSQAWPASWIKIHVTIHDDQAEGPGVSQHGPQGVAVNASHLYWANFNAGTIVEANLDGTGAKTIASHKGSPYGIAVNASHLYWANHITSPVGTINEANLDGTGAKVIASRQNGPSGVAVGP